MRAVFCENSDRFIFLSEYGLEIWSQRGHPITLHEPTLGQDFSLLTCFRISGDGSNILAGTSYGDVLHWDIINPNGASIINVSGVVSAKTSPRIIGLSLWKMNHCIVLAKDTIFLVNYESLTSQALEGATLPTNPGGITCSLDGSFFAISSPTEIVLYSILPEDAGNIRRGSSLVGHLQCPHTMIFGRDNTLFSCDAKVRGALRWQKPAFVPSDDGLDVKYCNACWTTHVTVEEIIPNGLFALLLHQDKSISIWKIDSDEKVQSFQGIACNFLLARIISENLFRVAYVKFSGEVLFGDISLSETSWKIKTYTWIRGMDTRKHKYDIEKSIPDQITGTSLPQFPHKMKNIDGKIECLNPKGNRAAQLHQTLSTGDQSEFEKFLIGNTNEFISQCVHSITDHQIEALVRALITALQREDSNVDCLAVAITWIERILEEKSLFFLRMDPCDRKALLSPIRVILNEYAHLEDVVHSFHCRLQCLHEMQLTYLQTHEKRSQMRNSKTRFYFRLQ